MSNETSPERPNEDNFDYIWMEFEPSQGDLAELFEDASTVLRSYGAADYSDTPEQEGLVEPPRYEYELPGDQAREAFGLDDAAVIQKADLIYYTPQEFADDDIGIFDVVEVVYKEVIPTETGTPAAHLQALTIARTQEGYNAVVLSEFSAGDVRVGASEHESEGLWMNENPAKDLIDSVFGEGQPLTVAHANQIRAALHYVKDAHA